jgi:1-acyl-sn-glycerol-3-phosphate acyltransferase
MNNRNDKAAQEVIAQFSPPVSRVFNLYIQRMMAKRFNSVRVLGDRPAPVPEERSVIFFSNHPGWYDPLIMVMSAYIYLPDHRPFGPMDADALAKYNFMKKIGIFGVEQASARGAARFLQISRGLLATPGKALMITPQGQFTDARVRPVEFKAGLARLAADCGAILQPLASEFVFWDEPRPEVLLKFGQQIDTRNQTLEPAEWKVRLELALTEAQDELAKAAIARDPSAFTLLIDGKHGVNPIYDLWRYLKALIKGEKFSAAHSDIRKDKS